MVHNYLVNTQGGNYELLAQLYGNRCQAYMQMQSYGAARDDALAAIHIKNHWAKAWYRLANAQMMLGHLEEAHKSCLMGIKKVHEEGDQLSRHVILQNNLVQIYTPVITPTSRYADFYLSEKFL